MTQLALDFGPPPASDFDNFVAGANIECVDTLRALAAQLRAGQEAAHRFIYVWGPPGSGKSHLASALRRATAPGLIIIDDCETLDDDAQQALFHAFNRLTQTQAGGLVSFGSSPPAQLALLPDLVSRLGWGLVYRLEPLDDLAMRAAWEEAARARGMRIGDEVGAYLLRHARRNMGELKGILDRIDRLSLERKSPVTVALVRDVLQAGPGRAGRPESAAVAPGHRPDEPDDHVR